jgi:hypothetical protein
VDGKEIPLLEKPSPPNLLDIKDVYSISWQGSAGASSYDIERRDSDNDPWINVAKNITDAVEAYKPLFIDTSAVIGNEYYYRVIARNENGASEPSNEVGPVKVNSLKIIDEMADESKIFMKDGNAELVDFKDIYKAKEDHSRIKIDSSASIIYRVPENVSSFKVYAFIDKPACGIFILSSDSLENFIPLTAKTETFPPYKNHYGFFTPVVLICEEFPLNIKYIKILCEDNIQLSRVEIEYSGNNVQQNNVVEK